MSLRDFLFNFPIDIERLIFEYLQEKDMFDRVLIEYSFFTEEFYDTFWHCNKNRRFPIAPVMRRLRMMPSDPRGIGVTSYFRLS